MRMFDIKDLITDSIIMLVFIILGIAAIMISLSTVVTVVESYTCEKKALLNNNEYVYIHYDGCYILQPNGKYERR